MENLPTGKDLIALGAKPGPSFKIFLEQARNAVSSGKAWESVKADISLAMQKEYARQPVRVELRKAPLQIPVAADPKTEEEEKNVEASLTKMKEVSLCPKVSQATLMPDTCPTGGEFGSIPVGGAIAADNAIIPAAHSADLFCSMSATFYLQPQGKSPVWKEILQTLAGVTRFGPFLRREGEELPHQILEEIPWNNPFLNGLEDKALFGLGTQGDGNHFAYLGEIPFSEAFLNGLRSTKTLDRHIQALEHSVGTGRHGSNLTALVTHHGSRNFGAMVYKRGLEAAVDQTNGPKGEKGTIPKNLCWLDLDTPEGQAYQEALHWVGLWTRANHQVIHREFGLKADLIPLTGFGNEHNAVWSDPQNPTRILHGKGATPAWDTKEGNPQIGIIPLNMASPILLTLGKGNPTYLGFSPHGAGRNRSRTETLAPFKDPVSKKLNEEMAEEALSKTTQGILVHWWSGKPDLSESPLGYKNPQEIKAQIESFGLAHTFAEISPRACIMAGEILSPWKKGKKPQK